MEYRLGLDLGTNSIGWALWKTLDGSPADLIDMGVRIFSDGCDAKSGESLAVTRREARGSRRLRMRTKRRQNSLLHLLRQCELLPEDKKAFKNVLDTTDPYRLRYEALRRGLKPYELGRILFQLGQRRGFKSNRILSVQEDGGNISKEEKESMVLIGKLKEDMRNTQISRNMDRPITLGEFLYLQNEEDSLRFKKTSSWRADRNMYSSEWDEIKKAQEKFNPDFANKLPWEKMKNCVFYQRALQAQERGRCTLYPSEIRAYKALPSFQNYRILQTLHNLEYQLPSEQFTLSHNEIQRAFSSLQGQNTMSFTKVAGILGYPNGGRFNFESEKRTKLNGNETAYIMQKPGHLKGFWNQFDAEEQDRLVEWLLSAQREDWEKAEEWMRGKGIPEENLQAVLKASFPAGVGNLSALAMRKLNERMLNHGEDYAKACESLGVHHSDHAYKGELLNELPYYGKILSQSCVAIPERRGKSIDPDEKEHGKIGNPRVHVALRQLQKVVNAIIERYGRPESITIEVTRELKSSRDSRAEMTKRQALAQKDNEDINKFYRGNGFEHPGRKDRQKYKLWKELSIGASHTCLYCGKNIGIHQLLTAETEVDHILPFSQTLDDGMANKTVVHRQCNQEKGNRTPYDAFASNPDRWKGIEERLLANPHIRNAKRLRFRADALNKYKGEKSFLARHGNDTAYISRSARIYLAVICPFSKIFLSPGILTDMLRGSLNLNYLLNNGKTSVERKWKKNRSDHRHHAVDALVIGLLSPSYLQKMAKMNQRITNLHDSVKQGRVYLATPPLPVSHDRIEKMLDASLISFKPDHGRNGVFFNDTAMGLSHKDRSVAFQKLNQNDYILDDEIRDNLQSQKADSLKEKKSNLLKENPILDTKEILVRNFYWTTRKELITLEENEIKHVYDDDTKQALEQVREQPGKWKENLKKFCLEKGCWRIKFIPKAQKAFALPLEFPLHSLDAQTAAFRDIPVQKGYAPGEYCMCIIWAMPDKQLSPHFYTYFEMQLSAVKNSELFKPHPAARKCVQVFKQDVLLLEPKNGAPPFYVRVAGFNIEKNRLDLQPIYAAKDHVEWRKHTNPGRVSWNIGNNSKQNYKTINTIFKRYYVKKAGLDVLGKPIYRR